MEQAPEYNPEIDKLSLWRELILGSGIPKEDEVAIVARLDEISKTKSYYEISNEEVFIRNVARYIDKKYPECFRWDTSMRQHKNLGYREPDPLDEPQQTIINLFRELREDYFSRSIK